MLILFILLSNIYFFFFYLFLNDELVIAISMILVYMFIYKGIRNMNLNNFFILMDIIYYYIYIYLFCVNILNKYIKEYNNNINEKIIEKSKKYLLIIKTIYIKYINFNRYLSNKLIYEYIKIFFNILKILYKIKYIKIDNKILSLIYIIKNKNKYNKLNKI
jgi:hypothetical protein